MSTLLVLDTEKKEREQRSRELNSMFMTVMESSYQLMDCEGSSLFIVDEKKQELWSRVMTDREGKLTVS